MYFTESTHFLLHVIRKDGMLHKLCSDLKTDTNKKPHTMFLIDTLEMYSNLIESNLAWWPDNPATVAYHPTQSEPYFIQTNEKNKLTFLFFYIDQKNVWTIIWPPNYIETTKHCLFDAPVLVQRLWVRNCHEHQAISSSLWWLNSNFVPPGTRKYLVLTVTELQSIEWYWKCASSQLEKCSIV